MGYYQSGSWSLTIPHSLNAQEIVEQLSEEFSNDCDFYLSPDEPNLTLTGYSNTKWHEDQDILVSLLAQRGVTGTIDFRGEDDELWRVRLHAGKLLNIPGRIIYDGDIGYSDSSQR